MHDITVIIPTYNRKQYLEQAIKSALSQTAKPAEIIVIDDGSTDGTEELLKNNYQTIRYFKQNNKGPAAARNLGLRMARGQLIAFLDDDDIWPPYKLEKQLNFLESCQHIDFVFGLYRNSDSKTPEILNPEAYKYFQSHPCNADRAFEYLIPACIILTSTVLLKKECIKKIGLFNTHLKCAEDFEYWLRFAHMTQIGFIDDILVERRIHQQNIVHDVELRLKSHLEVLETIPRLYQNLNRNHRAILTANLRKTCYQLGSYYFKEKRYPEAHQFLRRALPPASFPLKLTVKLILSYFLK